MVFPLDVFSLFLTFKSKSPIEISSQETETGSQTSSNLSQRVTSLEIVPVSFSFIIYSSASHITGKSKRKKRKFFIFFLFLFVYVKKIYYLCDIFLRGKSERFFLKKKKSIKYKL